MSEPVSYFGRGHEWWVAVAKVVAAREDELVNEIQRLRQLLKDHGIAYE